MWQRKTLSPNQYRRQRAPSSGAGIAGQRCLLTIASWNVNSVRKRLEQVLRFCEQSNVDVLALQETKVVDELFPCKEILQAGYEVFVCGQKGYNGVAVLAHRERAPVVAEQDVSAFDFPPNPKGVVEARAIAVELSCGITILNLYVVNGEALDSPKFSYKLAWFARLIEHLTSVANQGQQLVVGDFNIAPSDLDVYDPTIWKNRIHVSDTERALLTQIEAHGYRDVFRERHPDKQNCFSWWDYRTGAFDHNHGLRIDLSYANAELIDSINDAWIATEPRGWENPSDHAPILVSIDKV